MSKSTETRKGSANANERAAAKVTASSGNIFADLGIDLSPVEEFKTELALTINDVIRKRGLTQVQAARLTGQSQPRISDIIRGKLDDFTADRLIDVLLRLGTNLNVSPYGGDEPSEESYGHITYQRYAGC